jgi:hypothetical protein
MLFLKPLFLSLLLSKTLLFAITLTDDFSAGTNGWNNASVISGQLRVQRDEVANKVYSFGSDYVGQIATISFDIEFRGDWEGGGRYQDWLNVWANGIQIIRDTYDGSGRISYTGLTALLDSSGELNLQINPDTTGNVENLNVDNITISAIINNAPTDILLSSNSVNENLPSGTLVGNFTTTDPDSADSHTYALVNGINDNDNGSFSIINNRLQTREIFDYEKKSTYTIRVQTDDGNGEKYEKNFQININDTIDPPDFTCPNPKPFTRVSYNNIRGNIITIGNTNMCYNNGGSCDNPGDRRNNDINMMYSDPDGSSDTTTFNSSSAALQIPPTATIEWAKLYWQGYLVNENDSIKTSSMTVRFKTPTRDYINVDASFHDYDYNWIYFSSDRFYYQGSADVTNLVTEGRSGDYTVANIVSELGQPIGGSYGGWALVIVFKDPNNETLKNITVFDGYIGVVTSGDQSAADNYTSSNGCANSGAQHSFDVALSGFLTPYNGEVKSSLSIFAGEGDKGATGDHIQLTDKNGNSRYIANPLNPYDDIFNSTITYNGENITDSTSPISISPWYSANSNGIDIDTFDISKDRSGNPLITNGQTATTITLDTNGDGYMPSVFAFTTELYEPRVCYYVETIKQTDTNLTIYENRDFKEEIVLDKEHTFDIWISNMKKDINDTDIETARLVQVYMSMSDFDYTPNTMHIQNLGQTSMTRLTDTIDGDLGEYEAINNKNTWRVGLGADGSQGGTLEPTDVFNSESKKAFVSYRGKFLVDNNVTSVDILDFFEFRASFQTDSITIGRDNAQLIEQCVDINTSTNVIQPPRGVFNVINENFYGSSLQNDTDTALFTQVSGQSFSVQLVALDNDKSTLKNYTGDVNISIIETPSYTHNSEIDQALCSAAIGTNTQTITFNNEDKKSINIITNDSAKKLSFKVSYNNGSGMQHVCSTDSFAVRPSKYDFAFSPMPLLGGKNHTLTTLALDTNNIQISSYDGAASQTINLIVPTGCFLPPETNTSLITFSGGVDTSLINSGNIGDYNISVTDNTWTSIDQETEHGNDCILGSSENTPINGKVGCNTQSFKSFTFSPKDFQIALNIENFNNGDFTYISNDDSMASTLNFDVSARLDNNNIATAYDGNCYAKDINSTITLLTTTPHGWGTNDSDAPNRIRYFSDNTTTSFEQNSTATGSVIYSSNEGNFTNGSASLSVFFNFNKNKSLADMPFIIRKNDFNISIIDTNGTTGADFSRLVDQNITFYYGRVYAPDYQGPSPINAQVYYEVYCNDCNRVDFNITGNPSVDSPRWFINTHHDNINQGNVNSFNSLGSTTLNKVQSGAGNINNGVETIILSEDSDRVDRIQMTPDSWLVFNQFNPAAITNDFIIEFTNKSGWAGEGTVKKDGTNINIGAYTHDTDGDENLTLKRENRRINW